MRIYRNFSANGNGFLRGVRIEIRLGNVGIPALHGENGGRELNFRRFSSVSSHLARDTSAARRRSPACCVREKRAGAQASGKLGPPTNAMPGTKSSATDRIISSEADGKEKGRPEGRPSCSGCRKECRLRLSHHVHTASSARLTR
ncbi:hypothetical protein RHE_CH00827 [Rhizobium etli CFN 42]|uniref:Uncharacterized protein n=1 Tax=Rhizobium etli (strain ATCC 51251 / DSM 11541 / JCM 21823 / NBRC 15573 / CFN 42) TaxID=347834 RepID=Q2KBZ8_RHIEC|nr:hypothetical protein RHE_CH00827 [Rhizobium etli CFN 42]